MAQTNRWGHRRQAGVSGGGEEGRAPRSGLPAAAGSPPPQWDTALEAAGLKAALPLPVGHRSEENLLRNMLRAGQTKEL